MSTRIPILVACMSAIFCLSAFAQTGVINEAKVLIAKGNYQKAYDVLNEKEDQFGGKPEFDYYLGLSAIQIGKSAEAVFALERALDVKPDFQQARAELGRAYYYLGENKAAEIEFQNLKNDSAVPAGVKSTLDNFLAAIDNRFDASGTSLNFYVDFGIGQDSNINSATAANSFEGTIFGISGDIPIPEQNQETDSSFIKLNPGFNYQNSIRDDLNFFASANYELKDAQDADEFSNTTLNLATGLAKLAGADQFYGSLSFQQYKLDGESFRDQVALSGQWIKTLNSTNKLAGYFQVATLDYDQSPTRDGGLNVLGLNWLKSTSSRSYTLGAFYGDESVDDNEQQQQARTYLGLKAGINTPWKRNMLFANLTYQLNNFKAADAALDGKKRDGKFYSLDLGANFPLMDKLNLTTKINLSKNDTDEKTNLYDYDRTLFEVFAKYRF